MAAYGFPDCLGKPDAASLYDYIYVLALSAEKAVTYITSYHESPYACSGCRFRHYLKNTVVKKSLCNCHNDCKYSER